MNNNVDNVFYTEFISKFKDSYTRNPKRTLKLMKLCMAELGIDDESNVYSKYGAILFEPAKQLLIMFIIIGFCGLSTLSGFFMYLFGLAFFAGGFFVGTTEKGGKATLIFLFSHGLTGLIFMMAILIISSYKVLLASKFFFVLFGIGIGLCLVGFIRVILYSLGGVFDIDKYAKSKCLIFFTLGILINSIITLLAVLGVI